MPYLTRDQILDAVDIVTTTVDVPEWHGAVIVRGLTGQQRDTYEASIMLTNGKISQLNWINARAKLVAMSCVDELGQRIFGDDDVKLLAQKSAAALERVFETAQRLSGLTTRDLEELSKKSENGQHDALPID